jgi:hypothetical protein
MALTPLTEPSLQELHFVQQKWHRSTNQKESRQRPASGQAI